QGAVAPLRRSSSEELEHRLECADLAELHANSRGARYACRFQRGTRTSSVLTPFASHHRDLVWLHPSRRQATLHLLRDPTELPQGIGRRLDEALGLSRFRG